MAEDVPEMLSSAEAAALAGISPKTWSWYQSMGQGPAPDGQVGRTKWWRPETVRRWLASRPGQGRRTDLLARRQSGRGASAR